MSTLLQQQIAAFANEIAATGPDMTVAVRGGSGGRTLPDGYAFGRLVEYVEYGSQPQEFKGVPKDPAPVIRLGFALTGEGYSNEDGTPYIMRPFAMAVSQNEKAKAFLLFKALNYKNTAKHFAQLLGQAFLVKIYQYQPADKTKKPSSAIDLKGFLPPFDPVTKMPYPIPEARDEDFKVFSWEKPTLEGWKSLFIDGQSEDGSSKNFIQNEILGATDFSGSALEQLLLTSGTAFTKPVPKPKAVAAAAPAGPALPGPVAPPSAPPALTVVPAVGAAPLPWVDNPAQGTAIAPPATPAPVAVAGPALPSLPALPAMPALPSLPALPVAA